MTDTRTADSGHTLDSRTVAVLERTLPTVAAGECAHNGQRHAAREGCPAELRMPGVLSTIVALANSLGMAHRRDGRAYAPGTEMDLAEQAYRHGYAYSGHLACACALTLPDGTLIRAWDGARVATGEATDGCPCGALLPPHAVLEHGEVAATALAWAEMEVGTLRDSVRATR